MGVMSEGYCMLGKACWARRTLALGRSILAVLTSGMGLDKMLVDCGSVQKTSRNHKSN